MARGPMSECGLHNELSGGRGEPPEAAGYGLVGFYNLLCCSGSALGGVSLEEIRTRGEFGDGDLQGRSAFHE